MIIADEGYNPKPYRDSRGFWTGGIGHLLSNGQSYSSTYDTYSNAEWMHCFALDVDRAEYELNAQIPWWKQLNDCRQDGMINLVFNIPVALKWSHTMDAVRSGNFTVASIDFKNDQPWASQVGARSARIANLIETGAYGPGNYPQFATPTLTDIKSAIEKGT